MSLKLIEGYDHMSSLGLLQSKSWIVVTPSLSVGTVTVIPGRLVGNAIRVTDDTTQTVDEECRKVFPAAYTHFICGFAYRTTSIPLGDWLIGRFLSGAAQTVQIYLTSSSHIRVKNSSGTTIATGTAVVTAGAWHYLEFDITINGASGAVATQVDGAADIGATTGNFGSVAADTIAFAANRTNNNGNTWNDFDDVYVADATVSPNTTMLGDVHVETLYPNGEGSHLAWVPNSGVTHYNRVFEHTVAPYPDDDTTYNSSNVLNAEDSYQYDDLSITVGTVFGVQTNLYARKTDALLRQLKALTRTHAADFLGANFTLSTSYVDGTEISEVNPSTTIAWTIAEINAAEWGADVAT